MMCVTWVSWYLPVPWAWLINMINEHGSTYACTALQRIMYLGDLFKMCFPFVCSLLWRLCALFWTGASLGGLIEQRPFCKASWYAAPSLGSFWRQCYTCRRCRSWWQCSLTWWACTLGWSSWLQESEYQWSQILD